jgi:hypothetical protein
MEIEFKVCVSIRFEDNAPQNSVEDQLKKQLENDKKFDKAINTILSIVTPVTVGLIPSTALVYSIAEEGNIDLKA